ncbi:hypothetical protein M5K25_013988 [Dendrobium thyrsiflorum]|uniref:Uncharacterized protein n=1 Tax=Dendrobium thyrsiflorum TaxID=117978 RepID=A0ABD0UUU0_DENTH
MSGDHHPSRDHASENSSARRPHKGVALDDGASSVTSDSLTVFHKKFHFPNDLVATVSKISDRACLPPPWYIVVYETYLRAGLRFPPPPELIDIAARCGNDWGLIEKWGKLNDLPAPLHIREEDIMRILKVLDIEHLLYEVRYLGRYIEEEFLFKVGLSFHAGRSEAKMLKKSSKVPKLPSPVPKVAPKRQVGGCDPQSLKKKKLEGVATSADKAPPTLPPQACIFQNPEDVLNHQCIGRRRADDLLLRRKDLDAELTRSLNEWNSKFVKVKYLQGEYKRKYDSMTKEVKVLAEELSECRTELANIVHSVSLQNQQLNQLQMNFEGAHAQKNGVTVEGLTPSQASGDPSSDLDGDEIESELHMAFALEVDDEIVDIE